MFCALVGLTRDTVFRMLLQSTVTHPVSRTRAAVADQVIKAGALTATVAAAGGSASLSDSARGGILKAKTAEDIPVRLTSSSSSATAAAGGAGTQSSKALKRSPRSHSSSGATGPTNAVSAAGPLTPKTDRTRRVVWHPTVPVSPQVPSTSAAGDTAVGYGTASPVAAHHITYSLFSPTPASSSSAAAAAVMHVPDRSYAITAAQPDSYFVSSTATGSSAVPVYAPAATSATAAPVKGSTVQAHVGAPFGGSQVIKPAGLATVRTPGETVPSVSAWANRD